MKLVQIRLAAWLACCLGLSLSTAAFAAPYTVQIADIEMNNDGLYIDAAGNQEPGIFVRGTFTPALPCAAGILSHRRRSVL